MDVQAICAGLQQSSLATSIRENTVLFPGIESLHVLAVSFLVGSVAIVDLRLLGVRSFTLSIRELMAAILPLTWLAFAAAVVTGTLLFLSNALEYSQNAAFRWKLLILILAGLNAALFHSFTCRGLNRWGRALRTPLSVRAAGIVSLLCWVGIVALGRAIGFTSAL